LKGKEVKACAPIYTTMTTLSLWGDFCLKKPRVPEETIVKPQESHKELLRREFNLDV